MALIDKISKNALGIAMLTATANPGSNDLRRASSVVETPIRVLIDFGEKTLNTITHYTTPSDLLEILQNAENSAIRPMQNISQNIQDDPYRVLYAAIGAYLAFKIIPPILKYIFDRGTERSKSGLEKLGKSLEKR